MPRPDLLGLGPVEGPAGSSVVTKALTRALPLGAATGGNAGTRGSAPAPGPPRQAAAPGPAEGFLARPGAPAGAAAPAPALPEGSSG